MPVGQVIQRILHPGGRVEERIVQASSVPGQPGQMVIHGPGGQQQIIQSSSGGQVVQANQSPAQQAGQIVLQASSGNQQSTNPGQVVVAVSQAPRAVTPQTQVASSSSDSSTQLDLKQPKSAILQDLLKSKGVDNELKQSEKVVCF